MKLSNFVRRFLDSYLPYLLQMLHVFIVGVLKHILKFVVIGNVEMKLELIFFNTILQ